MVPEISLEKPTHYSESKVPLYRLPSPLERKDGGTVSTAFEWMNSQRRYVLGLFEEHVYGKIPPRPDGVRFELLNRKNDALNGLAIRMEIRIHSFMSDGRAHKMDLLLYLPKDAKSSVPVFLGLNFNGNHSTSPEKDILISECWFPDNLANESSRHVQESRWCFERLIKRGYASATICYNEIYPDDYKDGCEKSVYKLFHELSDFKCTQRSFGAISAWSWGLRMAMDCLETLPEIDSGKVILHGHSRLGKAALWAGACDQRFSVVISNDSGCGGAAISRRCFGESLESIQKMFPHWFSKGFLPYANNEDKLPVDQHMLISLMAPRPVYIASAAEDYWADPKGEFLSGVNALPVYRLFGSWGLGTEIMPPPDTPIGEDIAYHIRTGKHDITAFDWDCFMDFTDRKFYGSKTKA